MTRALQVYIDEGDLRSLRAWARSRGWTMSQAVRVAVKALTRSVEDEDPLLAASGMVAGLPADLSARIDEYLVKSFVAERPAAARPAPRRRARHAGKAVRR